MIHLFVQRYEDPNPQRNAELTECWERNTANPLLLVTAISFRPTFTELFHLAGEGVPEDDISIIANSDIYFDETIAITQRLQPKECWALSRWDRMPNGKLQAFHGPCT